MNGRYRVAPIFNGTFDGDQLQVKLMIDNQEREFYYSLRSSNAIIDTDEPWCVGGHVTLHPEGATQVDSFLTKMRVL